MNPRLRVCLVIGTRPELVKMAPLVGAMRSRPDQYEVRVVFSGQHRSLLDQAASLFGVRADVDLDLMRSEQSPSSIVQAVAQSVEGELRKHPADITLAQGDTATALGAALGAFHAQVPFGHVEAGLRTGDLYSPFPEEGYRRMISAITTHHFAPTQRAQENLLGEGVPSRFVHLTGNTVIDALYQAIARREPCPVELEPGQRLVLATLHRRESFGAPLARIVRGLASLLRADPSLVLALPMHPNPLARKAVLALAPHPRARLLEPLGYHEFVALLAKASLVITDSGGVQEEAPALGIPVLVARTSTERPEGVEQGCAELVGSDPDRIVQRALAQLALPARKDRVSPYGDGAATERILDVITNHYRVGLDRLGERACTG